MTPTRYSDQLGLVISTALCVVATSDGGKKTIISCQLVQQTDGKSTLIPCRGATPRGTLFGGRSVTDLPERLWDKELLRSVEELGRRDGFWVGLPAG